MTNPAIDKHDEVPLNNFGSAPAAARPAPTLSPVPTAPQAASKPASEGVVSVDLSNLNVSISVGEGDTIEGNIKLGAGKSIVIRGTVVGHIHCEGTVVVTKGGCVQGSIAAGTLFIEGDVNSHDADSIVDVGILNLCKNGALNANCTYDAMSVETPNRGIRGTLTPRSDTAHV